MGFSGNHLTSDLTENLPSTGTPGDLLSAFADRGDEAAFAEIVRRYAGMVFATCLKSTKDAHDAEDATQAVFLSLAVQIKTGKAVRALGPWLKQVAKRAGLDVRKSRKRRERREQAHAQNTAIELGCPDGVLGTPTPRITEYAQAASDPEELQRLVSQELNGLPATYRLPLISQYFGGLSQKQIATQLGIKPGAVAVRIHRGRVMLAKRLESLGAELPPGWSSGEDEPSVYACIGSAVSSMMVARIAQSMGQLGLGHGVTGNTTASLLSIARTAAAGAAAAAKLKIAIAVVLCASLAASATTWAKNAEIDFSSFPSLRPVIDFIRNLGGSRSITPMASSTSVSTPAPTTVATNQTAVATLPTLSNLPAGPTSPAFVPQTTVAGFTPGTALPTAPLSVASAGSVNVGVPPVPSLPQVASVEPAAARPAGESPASASILLAPETHTASSSAKRDLDVSVGTGSGSRVATGDVTLTGSGWLRTALSGTSESVVTPGHALNIGSGVGSVGQLTMRNDNLVADAQNIGVYGTGRLQQLDGGFNTATQINLGVGPTGSGIYDLAGTAVLRPSVASASGATGFSVGGHGHGELNLGDGKVAGMVWEASALSAQSTIPAAAKPMDLTSLLADPAHLIVRSEADGSGVIRGWGGANGNGSFVNNGVVTADGYGKERSLIFTGYTSVTNTIENLDGQHNGWFAQNLGRLRLPKLRVDSGTNTYTWGEDEKDTTLDLVNSVRVTLHDMPAADSLEINLLDKARADVPTLPTGHTFIGVWSFDTLAARPGSVDLTIRYDDALAQELKLNEGNLKIWEYVNGTWTRLDHDPSFTRDVADHILSATADGKLTYFAVSAPEPGSVGMLMILGSGMLLRRRRRLQPHR